MGGGVVPPFLSVGAPCLVGAVEPRLRAGLVAVRVVRGVVMMAMVRFRPPMVTGAFRGAFGGSRFMTVAVAMVRVVPREGWRRNPRQHRKRGGYKCHLIQEHTM